MDESELLMSFDPKTSKKIREIAERRGIEIEEVFAYFMNLGFWADRVDRAGDGICHKNGRTKKITEMNFPWPKPRAEKPEQKPKLKLIDGNPNAQPTPPRSLPPLQSVADPATDPEDNK